MGKKQRTDKDNSSARHSHFGVSGKNGKKKLARQQQQAPAGKAGKKKQKAKLAAAAGASSSSGAFRPKGGPPYACDQPILLLGEGDFSFAAALFCPRPLVLYVPFWLNYSCVPKAHALRRADEASLLVGTGKAKMSFALSSRIALPAATGAVLEALVRRNA